MKTNYTSVIKLLVIAAAFFTNSIHASAQQCQAPAMVWQHPSLIHGTAGQPGAQYKFPSVTRGVNAIVTLTELKNGATLSNIDDSVFGYNAAWQPVVRTATAQTASSSYASFKIEFKDSSNGNTHIYRCFQLSFIDVDGDGQHVREFVAAKDPDSVTVSNRTVLTLTSLSGNIIQATGTVANYTDIDTSSWNTNINFRFSNSGKVNEVRIGSNTDNVFTVQDRYSCGFFQQITMPYIGLLPVKYISFDAVGMDKSVLLRWVTDQEVNNNHFEVERSYDGTSFSTVSVVLDGFENGAQKNYQFTDRAFEIQGKAVIYYRLKQVDNNGRATYTNVIAVKLQIVPGMVMQASPNPFTENLNIGFASTETGKAEISISNVTGQKVMVKPSSVNKGYNTIQLDGLSKLTPGVYMVQLTVNGVVTATQKIIKN